MRYILGIFGIMVVATAIIWLVRTSQDRINRDFEKAYFEGQKDYLQGDIRIKVDSVGHFYWTKSPWDDGKDPVYVPK
jgi:hypothetical protein